jgi:hypothetical protein
MRLLLLSVVVCGIIVMSACTGCPPKIPTTRQLSWQVYNQKTGSYTNYSDGDTLGTPPPKEAFDSAAQYTVSLLAQDPHGIKEMDVSGVGNNFTCESADQNFQQQGLSANIQTTQSIPNSPIYYGSWASTPFVYAQLDCGVHQYGNMPHAEDFTVSSGILTVTGTEISGDTTKQTITLKVGI